MKNEEFIFLFVRVVEPELEVPGGKVKLIMGDVGERKGEEVYDGTRRGF